MSCLCQTTDVGYWYETIQPWPKLLSSHKNLQADNVETRDNGSIIMSISQAFFIKKWLSELEAKAWVKKNGFPPPSLGFLKIRMAFVKQETIESSNWCLPNKKSPKDISGEGSSLCRAKKLGMVEMFWGFQKDGNQPPKFPTRQNPQNKHSPAQLPRFFTSKFFHQ